MHLEMLTKAGIRLMENIYMDEIVRDHGLRVSDHRRATQDQGRYRFACPLAGPGVGSASEPLGSSLLIRAVSTAATMGRGDLVSPRARRHEGAGPYPVPAEWLVLRDVKRRLLNADRGLECLEAGPIHGCPLQ